MLGILFDMNQIQKQNIEQYDPLTKPSDIMQDFVDYSDSQVNDMQRDINKSVSSAVIAGVGVPLLQRKTAETDQDLQIAVRSSDRGRHFNMRRRIGAGIAASALVLAGAHIISGSAEQDLRSENPVTVDGLPPAGEQNLNDPSVVYGNSYTPPKTNTLVEDFPMEGGPELIGAEVDPSQPG